MKLTADSRNYIKRRIKEIADARKEELEAEQKKILGERNKSIEEVAKFAESLLEEMNRKVMDFALERGLTYMTKNQRYRWTSPDDNPVFRCSIDADDFAETATNVSTRWLYGKERRQKGVRSETTTEYKGAELSKLQKRIEAMDDLCAKKQGETIFKIETGEKDTASIEKILASVKF